MRLNRRAYQAVTLAAAEGGVSVRLDDKDLTTPGGRALILPNRALAEAIAAEWAAQEATIRPETMPLTQLAATALDRIAPERAGIAKAVLAYGGTDLLCYRADAPADLAQRQSAAWQPLLDWAETRLGARLIPTPGILAIAQPPASLAALAAHLDRLDIWRLSAVQAATAASGSLILALALAEGRIDGAGLFTLCQLDETYQAERWGETEEAKPRRDALAADLAAAARFLDLLR